MSKDKSIKLNAKGKPCAEAGKKIDWREQPYNGRACGPIERVQLPLEMITVLYAIVLDFDPARFRQGTLPAGARKDPKIFYTKFIRKFLQRHPVFARAEVRASGQGIHALIHLVEPVEFATESDRQLWAAIVKVVQKLMPTDPDCPGITALTRPINSTNSKNGATVKQLYQGEPVPAEEVLELFEMARKSPFRTVARLVYGDERITPCPICRADGSRLDALDKVGKCYGGCGKVSLGQLYDVYLKPRPSQAKE